METIEVGKGQVGVFHFIPSTLTQPCTEAAAFNAQQTLCCMGAVRENTNSLPPAASCTCLYGTYESEHLYLKGPELIIKETLH